MCPTVGCVHMDLTAGQLGAGGGAAGRDLTKQKTCSKNEAIECHLEIKECDVFQRFGGSCSRSDYILLFWCQVELPAG
jgi:hypothetical protein